MYTYIYIYVPPLYEEGPPEPGSNAVWEKIRPRKTDDSIAVWLLWERFLSFLGSLPLVYLHLEGTPALNTSLQRSQVLGMTCFLNNLFDHLFFWHGKGRF